MDQDSNPSNIQLAQLILLPSRLTKQLDELALFLGRVSSSSVFLHEEHPCIYGNTTTSNSRGAFLSSSLGIELGRYTNAVSHIGKARSVQSFDQRTRLRAVVSDLTGRYATKRRENHCSQGIDNDNNCVRAVHFNTVFWTTTTRNGII